MLVLYKVLIYLEKVYLNETMLLSHFDRPQYLFLLRKSKKKGNQAEELKGTNQKSTFSFSFGF